MAARKRANTQEDYGQVVINGGSIASSADEAVFKNAVDYGFTFDIKARRKIQLTEITFYVRERWFDNLLGVVDYEV